MSGQFQYFITPPAGKPTISLAECTQFGIGYAFDEENQPKCVRCQRGPRPDGAGGMVVCASTDRIGYYPERQKWRAMVGNPDVWVGMETAHVPTPENVKRSNQADGETLVVNGTKWLIPRARQWDMADVQLVYREVLPATLDVNDKGQWIRGDVIAQYAALWTAANEFADGDQDNADVFFASALGANYRIGPTEWAMLGLIDSQGRIFSKVLDIVLDEERGRELLKKTADLTGGMSNGSNGALPPTTDDQPDTGQQSPSHELGQSVHTGLVAGAA